MGQNGLIFLEGGGPKYLNQLNFQFHRSLGVKVQFFDSLPVQDWGEEVFSALSSVKLDLDILES